MSSPHPYTSLPDYAFWKRAVSSIPSDQVDPIVEAVFSITPTDRIVTAGSCFAQHIARRLHEQDFAYFVTELPHPIMPPDLIDDWNYGSFSARYGNIYTARQLRQLVDRAYGLFDPMVDVWANESQYIDPFRPQIQPNGFSSITEYHLDRRRHFAAVRQAIEELDVFVFTLGLTEAWRDRRDGAVYPLAPGVAGGTFDPNLHEFHNFSVQEVTDDLLYVIDVLRKVNPAARVLLTVSPVPLVD
jgi:hypothetical protein